MTFKEFNNLSKQEAEVALEKCCVSKSWIHHMIENIPFKSTEKMIQKAAYSWYDKCKKLDWEAAFQGHPKIGDIKSLEKKFASTEQWATNEQAKVAEADKSVLELLASANEAYLDKFGFIFIISARGKSAKDMLTIINARLPNSKEDELTIAMGEQHKITVIRLTKLIDELQRASLKSHITTHVLDTTMGVPGRSMLVSFYKKTDSLSKPITVGITDNDGRVSDLVPPGKELKAGIYELLFKTDQYYKNQKQSGFYPEVSIQFEVTDHDHYHVPLLLNPYGYSTYRGS